MGRSTIVPVYRQRAVSRKREPKPDYDVKNATGVYAGMAGTLSGFAFTAIVLLVREVPTVCSSECRYLRERVLVALIIGFIGCGISAFAFGVVAAERNHRRRIRAAFFAGNAFIVALGHLLWAIALLAHLFLPSPTGGDEQVRVALAASLGAIGTYILAPLFLWLAARTFEISWCLERSGAATDDKAGSGRSNDNDSGTGNDTGSERPRRRLWPFTAVPVLLAASIASWAVQGSAITRWGPEAFDLLALASGVLIVAMGFVTLLGVMPRNPGLPASSYTGVVWLPVVGTSLILACLLILLPQ